MLSELAAGTSDSNGFGHWGFAVVGALWIVIGAIHVVNPAFGWRMRRWQYRNPAALQPSDRALTVTRGVGVVGIVAGVALIAVAAATT